MNKPPRFLRVFIVNDDEVACRQFGELISRDFPNAEVRVKDGLPACMAGLSGPSILLIDVSAVAPSMRDDVHYAYGPITFFCRQYPNCKVVIISAMGRNATMEVVDAVNDALAEDGVKSCQAVYGGWGDWDTAHRVFSEICAEKDLTP